MVSNEPIVIQATCIWLLISTLLAVGSSLGPEQGWTKAWVVQKLHSGEWCRPAGGKKMMDGHNKGLAGNIAGSHKLG